MAWNDYNGHCRQCGEFVYKGNGFRLFVNADAKGPKGWDTFCADCARTRQTNKNKGTNKRAYIKRQPTLFD